jgi:hypothetical protein
VSRLLPFVGRRAIGALAVIVAVIAIAVLVGPNLLHRDGASVADGTEPAGADPASSATAGTTGTPAKATAKVATRDLVDRVGVDGTLGYGDSQTMSAGSPGTVVSLPEVGATVARGGSMITVDDHQLPLFYGTVPLWRDLSIFSTDGPDIQQLEENLVALGFADGLELAVDQHFDGDTQVAVQRWQDSVHEPQTAVVAKGDLVFRAGPVRIKERKVMVGDEVQPGVPALVTTGTDRAVSVRLDADRQSMAKTGDKVQIDLPGGTTVAGTVAIVGTVATKDESNGAPGDGGTAKITVTVTLDDPAAAGRLDEAPVRVKLTKSTAKHVLAVPVTALLALREGGYAVEVEANAKRSLVGVDLGAAADGWVQVTGNVHEGDVVVVAS